MVFEHFCTKNIGKIWLKKHRPTGISGNNTKGQTDTELLLLAKSLQPVPLCVKNSAWYQDICLLRCVSFLFFFHSHKKRFVPCSEFSMMCLKVTFHLTGNHSAVCKCLCTNDAQWSRMSFIPSKSETEFHVVFVVQSRSGFLSRRRRRSPRRRRGGACRAAAPAACGVLVR